MKDGIEITIESIPELTNGNWCSVTGCKSDAMWIQEGDFQVNDEAKVIAKVNENRYELQTRRLQNKSSLVGIKSPTFGYEFGATVMNELKSQLDSCNQLLECEPDSKWTLLTAALLMRSIDRFSYHETTLEFLKKLQKVDFFRAGYYKDLASKWTLEVKLKNWIETEGFLSEKIDLSGLDLTMLYYQQYFAIATEINLQGNPKLIKTSCKLPLVKGCEVRY